MYCGLVHQQQVGLSVFYRDERGAHMELDPDTSRSIIQQATRISTTLLELLSRDSRSKATIKCDYTTTSFRPSNKGQKNGTRRDRHQGMVPCWEDFSVTDAAQHTYSLRVRIVMEEYNGGPHAAEDGPLPSSVELEVLGASASKWLPARLLATPSLPSEEDTRLMTACGKHATSMRYVGNAGALMLFVLVSVTTLAMQYPPSMCEGVYIVPERIALPVAQLCS
eukprot:jgi/Tetstr1/463528/TSEL_008407.t1